MTSRTPWEDTCLHWFRRDPQGFLDLFFPQKVKFCHELPREVEAEKYQMDLLLEVEIEETGERILVHIEFQTYTDPTMAERLLVYNVNTSLKYKKPVLSIVWHLMNDAAIAPSPLIWQVPVGRKRKVRTLVFAYIVVEVGKMTPRQLRALGHPILLPLIPLTKGGKKRDEIEAMSQDLLALGLEDLQVVGLTFAGLKLRRNRKELAWLHRRYYQMMQDVWKESPFIQWFIEEGMEKGLVQGKAEVVAQIVRARFPALVSLSQQRLACCSDQERLGQVAVKLALAQDAEEAREALLALPAGPESKEPLPPS